MRVHAFVAMSNLIHVLVSPTTTEQMADFMRLARGNISKEAGRLHDWTGTMFRIAAERLASGDTAVAFPENCYPPSPLSAQHNPSAAPDHDPD